MIKPSKQEVEQAIKTIIRYIDDNPEREGLQSTPSRVLESYATLFGGYTQNISDIMSTQFFDAAKSNDLVLLRNISFSSTCEHHMLPIIGNVDIGYIPDKSIIGISKLVRLVEIFARRMQVQERLTVQIAENLQKFLSPLGTAVKISASHCCMSMRGVSLESAMMHSIHYTGIFLDEEKHRRDFLSLTHR